MARPDDESGYDSACEDEYGGGVLLAEYDGDMMELDAHQLSQSHCAETTNQRGSSVEENCLVDTELLDPAIHPSENIHGEGDGPPTELETAAASEGIVDHSPFCEDTTTGSQYLELYPGHHWSSSEAFSTAAMVETLDDWGTATNATSNETIDSAEGLSATHDLDDGTGSAVYSESGISSGYPPQDPASAGIEHHQLYPQMSGWDGDLQNQFSHDFSAACDLSNNMSFVECRRYWRDVYQIQQRQCLPHSSLYHPGFPLLKDCDVMSWRTWRSQNRATRVTRADIEKARCDIQGVDWSQCGTSRQDMRKVRRRTYINLTKMITDYPDARAVNNWTMLCSAPYMNREGRDRASAITNGQDFFRFDRMSLDQAIFIPHFQLRHIVSASSSNAIFYPTVVNEETGSQITCVNPDVEVDNIIIDSASCGRHSESPRMQKIFTLSAKNDVLITGGLNGEYAMKSLTTAPDSPFTSGMVTNNRDQSSTNHVHTYLDRRSGLPQAVFSSNDSRTSTLDCMTNTFTSHHHHNQPVNCAATSPDTRLRLLVRDAKHPLVVDVETGRRIAKLSGHSDYGFACDWSGDGFHIATGAQDGLVHIYDLRNWKVPLRRWRNPVRTLAADLGGVRTLAFSPQGSGPPVLVMAESADFVHVLDGVGFDKKQTIDFFGEVAGLSFEPEGQRLWVGVGDPDVGGLMEFERNREGRFAAPKDVWAGLWKR
ncbi:MAG: hypothetical protein LQ346_006931 [Caloplaca aetnensis]|nr:MAG: hypothetical protein LQ346_006931 [Caloplaca aetnensis]